MPVLPCSQAIVLFLGQGLAFLVDRIIGIIQRMVQRVIVNGEPCALFEDVDTAFFDHFIQAQTAFPDGHRRESG